MKELLHYTSLLLLGSLLLSCVSEKKEPDDGWIKLFNGEDLSNWNVKIKGYPSGENYGNTFKVDEGELVVNYEQYENWDNRFGHLFYKEAFSSYLLVVEYRFVDEQLKNGPEWAFRNSGVMLHSQSPESMKIGQDFPISLEMQFLGGNNKGSRSTGNLCTPGTLVELNGTVYKPHCVNSSSETYSEEKWVRAEVLVLKDSIIKHIIEGDTVLIYRKPIIDSEDDLYNPRLYDDQQKLTEGYIALQSESHPIKFRKVELFDLEKYYSNSKKLKEVLESLSDREKNYRK